MTPLRSFVTAASLAVTVGLAGCGSADDGSSAETREERIAAEFVGTTPGGVDVLIERGDTLRRAAAGVGSDAGEELVPGRPFRVGSVSKPFVAVMVLQLVEEGSADLDAPLSDYLPDTVVGAEASIRQLLSHESGIPSYTDQPEFFTDVYADLTRSVTPAEILAYVSDVPPGPVGEFAYSNTNYILLGQLVEELDGTDLNASLRARVTGPLGLENTVFDTGIEPLPDDVVGGWSATAGDGDPAAPYAAIASSAWAAGALVSTTDDLAGFLTALATGQLVSSDSLAAMTEFGSEGYGLGLVQAGFSPTQAGFGHNGAIDGFTSTMAIDPATGDTLVILTNNDALSADELAPQVLLSP